MIYRFSIIYSCFFLLAIFSCKKRDVVSQDSDPQKQQILGILDSVYLYAAQIYLWNDQLPSYEIFRPERFYSHGQDEIKMYRNEIFELSEYAKSLKTGRSFEFNSHDSKISKYSTIIANPGVKNGKLNENILQDYNVKNLFGLAFAVKSNGDVRVLYVDPNSPAGRAGLKRGDKISKINGQPVKLSSEFYTVWISALKGIYVDFEIVDNNGAIRTAKLGQRFYDPNPVLSYKVINAGGKKIGFMAYNNFTNQDNTNQYISPVFYLFAQEKISDIIIDLRYNGGGYQKSVQYIANKLIPVAANGSVMYTEHYNRLMQSGKAEILRNQPLLGYNNHPVVDNGKIVTLFDFDYGIEANTVRFAKDGGVNSIKNVYFIVSRHTASASELLINVLKPYLNVKLIGVSDKENISVKTYGKPVGFFDINLPGFKLYMAMYQNKNAKGEGDYFDGFSADYSTIDNPDYDFGSVDDPAIRLILDSYFKQPALMKRQSRTNDINKGKIGSAGVVEYFFNDDVPNEIMKDINDLKSKY